MNHPVITGERAASKPLPRMVHEAETQRQHVRVQIPIRIALESGEFVVPNWSVGGVAIENMTPPRTVGEVFHGQLVFPLDGYEFAVPVVCDVRHVTGTVTGCQFVELAPTQLALLQYLVGAYVSGELVTSGDLMSITNRQNFTPSRDKGSKTTAGEQRGTEIRRLLSIALLGLFGAALTLYVAMAVYMRVYVSAFEGFVGTPASSYVRAPSDGVIDGLDLKPMDLVSRGTLVGSLSDPEGRRQDLVATCDCVVVAMPAPPGSVVQRGSPVAVLTAPTSPVVFVVRARSQDAVGVEIGDRAAVTFYNGEPATGGTVVGIERYTPIDYSTERGSASPMSYVVMQIRPDRPYTLENYGEPVRVRIDRLQLFATAPAEQAN